MIPLHEQSILQVLQTGGKFTQRELARSEPFLNCHKHELESVPKQRQFETTLRQVRQLIRNLRIIHHQPILSDTKGYWYSTDIDEAAEVIKRMEVTAKAQAASWHETYKAMRNTYNIRSDYFDGQMELYF